MKKIFTNVDGAQNGVVALTMFKESGAYDVVLSDIRMPKMSGLELLKELRKLDSEIFIAIMTGSPELDLKETIDCDIFMSKPIDIANMQLMLDMLMKKKGL